MTYQELVNGLKATGYPVAYSHFKQTELSPIPNPPFICYVDGLSDNFQADNRTFKKLTTIEIELYTDKKDLVAEGKLEAALDSMELPYDSSGAIWIEEENLFQNIYEVRMI